MRFFRLPVKDPRTVARDIPGICDLLFPQLLPAIVSHLNREAQPIPGCTYLEESLIAKMTTNAAMLFEVAYVRAEQILEDKTEDWNQCLNLALNRQSKYFDADLPEKLTEYDLSIASKTASNLVKSIRFIESKSQNIKAIQSPVIPGYQWISQGHGDFSVGTTLIEVKCTSRNFSSSDYRQILIYWLLSFSSSIEGGLEEWKSGILLNPRLNKYIEINFDELMKIAGAGRSKIEILELFSSLVGDYGYKLGNQS
ncbi:hypothetical protein GCM10007978_49690 [Shewanella hanedai]|uniref:Restriction endonuclease n=1 Tax=Shewanella hanedai TaxID=25 RepID=A0A553JB85_SHEHA|nr:hypothetical protein [Shewanella hanedai]TRY09722.1 hypothetical protein FN961_25560 [Shewanella hanedai]GGJ06154.1 hypothetical protein GCM10007978_49690 [Shewanella hanedai]